MDAWLLALAKYIYYHGDNKATVFTWYSLISLFMQLKYRHANETLTFNVRLPLPIDPSTKSIPDHCSTWRVTCVVNFHQGVNYLFRDSK